MKDKKTFTVQTNGVRLAVIKIIQSLRLPFEIVLQTVDTTRTVAQNRMYWMWMEEIADQVLIEGKNLTQEDWHDLCRMKFLGVKTIKIGHKEFPRPAKSTKELGVKGFSEYLLEIETHFLAKGVLLTFPDDYEKIIGNKISVSGGAL